MVVKLKMINEESSERDRDPTERIAMPARKKSWQLPKICKEAEGRSAKKCCRIMVIVERLL
jgi:hypothetical protein